MGQRDMVSNTKCETTRGLFFKTKKYLKEPPLLQLKPKKVKTE